MLAVIINSNFKLTKANKDFIKDLAKKADKDLKIDDELIVSVQKDHGEFLCSLSLKDTRVSKRYNDFYEGLNECRKLLTTRERNRKARLRDRRRVVHEISEVVEEDLTEEDL